MSIPPVTVLSFGAAVGVALAELRIASLIRNGVAVLNIEAYSAAAPDTCGVAIDVPSLEP